MSLDRVADYSVLLSSGLQFRGTPVQIMLVNLLGLLNDTMQSYAGSQTILSFLKLLLVSGALPPRLPEVVGCPAVVARRPPIYQFKWSQTRLRAFYNCIVFNVV